MSEVPEELRYEAVDLPTDTSFFFRQHLTQKSHLEFSQGHTARASLFFPYV